MYVTFFDYPIILSIFYSILLALVDWEIVGQEDS